MGETPNDTKARNIHRGERVREIVDKSKQTIGEVAERIGRSRTSLYRDFENPEMNWTYIMRIGAVIGHDFSADFPELSMYMENFVKEEVSSYNAKDEVMERLVREIDKWKTEAYKNLAEMNKWKDLYYQLATETGKIIKAS